MHIVIIDVNDSREINVYGPFNPANNQNQLQFFQAQLELKKAIQHPQLSFLATLTLTSQKFAIIHTAIKIIKIIKIYVTGRGFLSYEFNSTH